MQKRLSGLLVNSYGFATFSFTLMISLAATYYSIFRTDVALISAAHVSIIMAVTHIVEAISVPFSGSIIQKSSMPWGISVTTFTQPFFLRIFYFA